MKTPATLLFAALIVTLPSLAEDSLGDKMRRAFEKTKQKMSQIADTVETKSRSWYKQAKENLRLSRPDYLARADRTLNRYTAEIGALKEFSAGPGQRDYFRTRVAALEQHAAFARQELETLRASESDEVFHARQSPFDRTLWTLEAALAQAQEEAGL